MPPYMRIARPFLLTAPNPIQASDLELSSLILLGAAVYPLYIIFYRRAVGHFSSDKITFYPR